MPDRTMRIAWFKGRPYGVTNDAPEGLEPGYWYVVVNRSWRRLFPAQQSDDWEHVHSRVIRWLSEHVTPQQGEKTPP